MEPGEVPVGPVLVVVSCDVPPTTDASHGGKKVLIGHNAKIHCLLACWLAGFPMPMLPLLLPLLPLPLLPLPLLPPLLPLLLLLLPLQVAVRVAWTATASWAQATATLGRCPLSLGKRSWLMPGAGWCQVCYCWALPCQIMLQILLVTGSCCGSGCCLCWGILQEMHASHLELMLNN
jgi:hypothetical protein